MRPKWHPIPFIGHYFWPGPIGNRVLFGIKWPLDHTHTHRQILLKWLTGDFAHLHWLIQNRVDLSYYIISLYIDCILIIPNPTGKLFPLLTVTLGLIQKAGPGDHTPTFRSMTFLRINRQFPYHKKQDTSHNCPSFVNGILHLENPEQVTYVNWLFFLGWMYNYRKVKLL